ncbi:MAG TPA: hypothetical protein DCZ75_15410 [Geobacter sp.]|nr:hypothetical protein [Geobacter sp.]
MVRRMSMLLLITALLGACATYPDRTLQRLETLPQRYSQFDAVMAWETKTVGGNTVVDGVIRNIRYHVMYDVEIWVSVLDAAGKVRSRSVGYIVPSQLNLDQSTGFTVKLPMVAEPGTRLRFTYKYRASEGGDDRFGSGLGRPTDWMQSFETAVPAR